LVARTPLSNGRHLLRMNGQPWLADGCPVSLTKLMTALFKALVRAAV
jgi:hypothetical protein